MRKGMVGLLILCLFLVFSLPAQAPPNGFSKLASITTTTYTDVGCPDGTTCYYQVYALDANGIASPAAIPTTLPSLLFLGTQDYVTGIIPASGTHSVVLTWTASTGDVSYVVYRYTPPLAPVGLGAVVN